MDLNADIMQREGIQSTYGTFSSAGDVSTTSAGAHSMAHAVMATQALMPGLFAFQSLTPCSAVQPHSMSYVLPTSSQLLSDCTVSTSAGGSGMISSAINNALQSTVTPGMTGMLRPPTTIPGTLVQPSSTAYTNSNRVSFFPAIPVCLV